MSVRLELRKVSKEKRKEYRKIGRILGIIKQKIGLGFKVLREELTKEVAIACVFLWTLFHNFHTCGS